MRLASWWYAQLFTWPWLLIYLDCFLLVPMDYFIHRLYQSGVDYFSEAAWWDWLMPIGGLFVGFWVYGSRQRKEQNNQN